MQCDKCRAELSAYMEGLLGPRESENLRSHLDSCGECRDFYSDLKKTVEHIGELEEVEPPAWFTQKVMARVREEKEKKGIWRKLFYPLHIKLPIEAAATLIIAITAVYVFKATEYDMNTEVLKPGEVAEKHLHMEDEAGSRGAESPRTEKEPAPAATVGKTVPATRPEEVRPASPPDTNQVAPKEKQPLAELRGPLPQPPQTKFAPEKSGVKHGGQESEGMRNVKRRMESSVHPEKAESEAEPAAAAPTVEMDKALMKDRGTSSGEAGLELAVGDIDNAIDEIKKVLPALDGRIVSSDVGREQAILTVDIKHRRVNEFLKKLETVGRLEEYIPSSVTGKNRVRMILNIKKMPPG